DTDRVCADAQRFDLGGLEPFSGDTRRIICRELGRLGSRFGGQPRVFWKVWVATTCGVAQGTRSDPGPPTKIRSGINLSHSSASSPARLTFPWSGGAFDRLRRIGLNPRVRSIDTPFIWD